MSAQLGPHQPEGEGAGQEGAAAGQGQGAGEGQEAGGAGGGRENLESEIVVCGERVKSVKVGKTLGLLVSHDMTWKDQVDKTVKSCQEKLRGLWK